MAETDVTRLDQDVADIKADLRQVKEGQSALAESVAEIKGELRGELRQLSQRVATWSRISAGYWVF
jgi:hypothetical protein